MIHRLFTVASAISLLVLCIATLAIWVRSYRPAGDYVGCGRYASADGVDHVQWVQAYEGQLQFVTDQQTVSEGKWSRRILQPDPSAWWSINPHFQVFQPLRSGSFLNRLGFAHRTETDRGSWFTLRTEIWSMPLWVLVLGFSIVQTVVIMNGLRQRRRSREGLCSRCGYDLRVSKERCPECGTPITAAPGT